MTDIDGVPVRDGDHPLISVVVLNWNGKETIETCLRSLIGQTYPNLELIVVDNASGDGSDRMVADLFPSVKLIPLDRNTGFAVGCNVGITASRGEFVALLNNDAEADPEWILELWKGIRTDPGLGSCASRIVVEGSGGILDSAGEGLSLCGVTYKRGSGGLETDFSRPEPVFGACAGAALYRRSMLKEVGLFDEDFFLIYEDGDLSFRSQLEGYRCLYVPTARVIHKVNYSIGRISDTYVYYGHRNAEFLFFKNAPRYFLLRYFHHHALYVVLSFFFFLVRGKGWVFLKAKKDFLQNLRKTLRKRKEIQMKAQLPREELERIVDRSWVRTRILQKL